MVGWGILYLKYVCYIAYLHWLYILIDTWIMQRSAILFGLFGTPLLVDTWTEPSFFLGGSVLMPSMIWQTMSLGACFGEMDKLMSRLQRSLGCMRQKSWQFPNQRKIVQVAVKYMMKDDLPWNSSPQRTWFPAFVLRNPSMQLVILIHYLLWKDNRFWKPLPGSRPVAEWLLDGAGGGVCWSGRGVQLLSSKYQENDLLWFCLEVQVFLESKIATGVYLMITIMAVSLQGRATW